MVSAKSTNKVAMVTGATSGIGYATALKLAQHGYNLSVLGRREERMHQLCAQVTASGSDCLTITADLSIEGQAGKAVRDTLEYWERLDVVVAAAGHGKGHGALTVADHSVWASATYLNLASVMELAAASSHALAACHGSMIIIGSIFALDPAPHYSAYAAAKHGLRGFVRSIQRETEFQHVRVSLINPGTTNTEFASALRGDNPPHVHDPAVWGFEPLRPVDIAETVAWVISQPKHVNVEEVTLRATDDK